MHKDECPATTWSQMVDWGIANGKGKSQIAQVFKIVFTETCHTISLERNQRIFEGKRADVAVIVREVAHLCYISKTSDASPYLVFLMTIDV